ncbi:hypothetical protein E2C01_058402 [Portunus trituberculatus]|uniref:Uncharacterized protein n=1 Tax=Portunus trituberculatus TaxID=210409 RepID=A0A5B7GWC1_PORTR|nr:hypothetical protein [Portunus trituberculatus]
MVCNNCTLASSSSSSSSSFSWTVGVLSPSPPPPTPEFIVGVSHLTRNHASLPSFKTVTPPPSPAPSSSVTHAISSSSG